MEPITGLSTSEVIEQQRLAGFNELPQEKRLNFLPLLLNVVSEPMFLLLLTCGILYLILGNVKEAFLLLSFVFIVIGITFYQENKTEKALSALRNLSSPRALVMRNGEKQRIAGREVVYGDVLLLGEGDRVPADAVLLSATNLSVDEALLTGESVPVKKIATESNANNIGDNDIAMLRPGGDNLPFVYAGTLIVSGQAIAKVIAIGINTALGKIGTTLQILEPEKTNLQYETKKLVKIFTLIGLALCLAVVLIYGISRGHWIQAFLSGLSLAMAAFPEEVPVVLTVFLALGAWLIAQRKVLTRRVPAVEMIGAITTLCVDKTGTLTLNKMSVASICVTGKFHDVSIDQSTINEEVHNVVEYALLATPANPFDPMEKAIKELGERVLKNTEHLHHDWVLLHEYSLSDKLLAVSHVWKSKDYEEYVIAAKGAPEAIMDLCHLSDARQQEILQDIAKMAEKGLRVIGVAQAYTKAVILPDEQHAFEFEFLGLLGLSDPIRPEAPQAIAECYAAGIRILMITGDYPGTAKNIAQQIGFKGADNILIGADIDKLNDVELQERIKSAGIFARVVPEQKLRIVKALKANNEVVAMTGDGVNDAPALKSAHIGIAMGNRGSDVARETAAMVLLDDNFASIVAAIRMGRRIFDNLQKALTYILAVHLPIIGLAIIPIIFGWPVLLYPVHIVFLELIIDPVCSVVFESEIEEVDIMQRPPRNLIQPLFNQAMLIRGLTQGLIVLFTTVIIYMLSLQHGYVDNAARAFALINLVIANLGLVFNNRSWRKPLFATLRNKNVALWWVVGGAVSFLILTMTNPFLRDMFNFSTIGCGEAAICLGVALVTVSIIEALKKVKLNFRQGQ